MTLAGLEAVDAPAGGLGHQTGADLVSPSSFLVSSLFDLRTVSSSRPARAPGRRAQAPSRLAVATHSPQTLPPPGHALTVASTASGCPRSGREAPPLRRRSARSAAARGTPPASRPDTPAL